MPHERNLNFADTRSIEEVGEDSRKFHAYGHSLASPYITEQKFAAQKIGGNISITRARHLGSVLKAQFFMMPAKAQRRIEIATFKNLAAVSVETRVEDPETGNEVYDLVSAQSAADYLRSRGWRYRKAAKQTQELIDSEIAFAGLNAVNLWARPEQQ
jgi:hypothetical protein